MGSEGSKSCTSERTETINAGKLDQSTKTNILAQNNVAKKQEVKQTNKESRPISVSKK